MRWVTGPSRKDKLMVWHKWFAWRPIKINGTTVWLETVYRKGTWRNDYVPHMEWEYNLEGQM